MKNIIGNELYVTYLDNVTVPQADLPTLTAKMEGITLIAKARRIAVFYSQMAAFQSKQDYGFDLGDALNEQAVGRLQYEIDTEVVSLLDAGAGAIDSRLTWSKTLPVGVSKRDHYAGFAEILGIADQILYDRTKRFAATYMVASSSVKPILLLMDAFTPAATSNVNGPYFAGSLGNIKVYISPEIAEGEFFFGVNGNDAMSSAAVFAPYMAVVPTQLLQFADGGTQQGFSTLYDLKLLNAELLVKGKVTA